MNGESTAEIRFFDLTTRIGRMRYLAYSLGLSLLGAAAVMVGLICFRIFAPLGILALGAIYIAAIVFSIGLSVRRLHDMDASGWWTLLMLVPLANLILILFLLFKPGTQGDNRFGPMPPPNSTWVLVGAWCYILVYPFAIIGILAAIAIPAYQDYIARSQMSEGIQLAGQAEVPVSQFYQKNKIWPTDISSLYSGRPNDAVGRYVATISVSSSQDGAWGVIATMKEQGVNRMISGKAVELWTNDGGQTWRCGPASSNPVDAKYLPVSCRDTEPSPP